MKLVSKVENRIENMLKRDKEDVPTAFLTMIKSEIYNLMSNYCFLDLQDIKMGYYVDENGAYHFKFDVLTRRLKSRNFLQ